MPNNIILNEKLRVQVASTVMFDWCHVYVSDGLADVELGLCMKGLHSARAATTFQELGEYVATWTLPKAHGSLAPLFKPSANKNNAKKSAFTSTASQVLTLVPILHRYFSKVVLPRGVLTAKVLSLIAVLNVKTGCVRADALRAAIVEHLTLFLAAYGWDFVRPKRRYALQLTDIASGPRTNPCDGFFLCHSPGGSPFE